MYDSRECEIQTKQENEIMEKELVSNKEKLMEAEEACKSEKVAKNKVDELLKEAQAEITKLRNTTGMLKLQLKCALNEKELCKYKLAEERTKAHTHGDV